MANLKKEQERREKIKSKETELSKKKRRKEIRNKVIFSIVGVVLIVSMVMPYVVGFIQ